MDGFQTNIVPQLEARQGWWITNPVLLLKYNVTNGGFRPRP